MKSFTRHGFLLFLCIDVWLGFASSVVQAAPTAKTRKAKDFLVEGLQDVEPSFATFEGDMYAGLLPVKNDDWQDDNPTSYENFEYDDTQGSRSRKGNEDTQFMFWLFVPDQQSAIENLVVWLNGGPGCSSILGGVLLENSPISMGQRPSGSCCINPNDPLRPNPEFSWTVATTMLYVEQPTGVGFSVGGHQPRDENDVAKDFYGFLQNFYKVFPHLQPYRLSIFGESYAGMFAPAIAHRIATENDRIQKYRSRDPSSPIAQKIEINLEGLALGNGWMDATVQGPAVIDYAWWHGMIDAYTRDAFHAEWQHCYGNNDRAEGEPEPFHSFTVPDECGIMEAVLSAAGAGVLPKGKSINTYDVSTFDPYPLIGIKNSTIHNFMNDPRVKEALHAPKDVEWSACIPGAGRRRRHRTRRRLGLLDNDEPISVVPYVAELLDKWNIRVLIYNGDLDMSTNAQGSEMLLNEMEWSGRKAWKVASRGIWMSKNETVAGYAKKYAGLTFVVVKNSGHLVPMNVPATALDLVERFLRNKSFQDIPLPSFLLTPPPESPSVEAEMETYHDRGRCRPSSKLWVSAQCLGAILCFLAGFVSSMSWRRKGYQRVEDANVRQ